MKRLLLQCTLAAAAALTATAQTMDEGKYLLADETQLWRNSQNAAGMAFDMRDSSDNRGVALFNMQHRSGDYHRVQEGGQLNSLRFFTERYQKIGRYLYGYGSFDFDMGRVKNRAWSDVLRPYNSNPFISGSSVPGKYDHQDFALNARLGSVRLGHFNYGASLTYKVGDLSRLRDPRSRVRTADYQLTPSVTYTFETERSAGLPQNTVGLAAWYHRYKEKLNGLTTVQNDPNLMYYTMSGMEYAQGAVGAYSSYQREYVNHEFGGELSYGFSGMTFNSVTALTMSHGTEYAYGQYKYEPGRWYTNHFSLSTHNRLKSGGLLHTIDYSIGYEEGYADQYNQELLTERNGAYTTQYWRNKMTYKKRSQLQKTDLSMHYRLSWTADDAMTAFAGLSYTMQNVSNKHLLPTSELKYCSSLLGMEGGYSFLGNRLWMKAAVNCHIAHKADIHLADASTDYAQGVLLPDMEYYRADYWQGRLEVVYQQPLTVKGQRTLWFAKAYGSYLKSDNSLEATAAGLSVGLYY